MRASYHARTVNGPFDDPALFVPFLFEKRAVLFDLGEINSLSPRDVLKISHVFITHTHMDHFAGFDRILRLMLGREKTLYMFGPRGFLENIRGKLAGYTWNLVDHYENRFAIHATEVREDTLLTEERLCRERFEPRVGIVRKREDDLLLGEPALTVSTKILDHGIPCLGFSMKERFHINIMKDGLLEMGLGPGPWLGNFKEALFRGADPKEIFHITTREGDKERALPLGELTESIARITPGQKIAYVSDVSFSPENQRKIKELARDADHLFIEAAFLDEHEDIAREKKHLTAKQAGALAGAARVKRFTLFHHSPRYMGMEEGIQKEAQKAYEENLAP